MKTKGEREKVFQTRKLIKIYSFCFNLFELMGVHTRERIEFVLTQMDYCFKLKGNFFFIKDYCGEIKRWFYYA